MALEFDIAAIHDPSKCDQIVSYGNPNASVQITLAFEGGHYKLVDPNPDVKLPEKGSNMVAEAEEGYGMAAPRVVEPRVRFQALLANPGYLAVLTKRGFLGLPRLAPSKLLLRLGLGLPPACCSARPLLSLSKGLRLAEIILLAVALDLSLALAAKALRPCKVNSGLFTGCVMFATRRFRAPLSGTCCMVLFAWACGFL